ncbi:BAI1-associated protein 3 [Aphelenchoides besseyi]|nr:BAI1-associated protein 3 [Aphelenchoides besseyi]
MNDELYGLTIRALLHDRDPTDSRQAAKFGCKSYTIIEELRNLANFDESHHLRIVHANENCVEHSLKIELDGEKSQQVLLQINRSEDGSCAVQEAVISSGQPTTIALRHGRNSVIRVFPSDLLSIAEDSQSTIGKKCGSQKHNSFLKRWYRMNVKDSALLTLKLKHLSIGRFTQFDLHTVSKSTLKLMLSQREVSGGELKPMDLKCLATLVRSFCQMVIQKRTNWESLAAILDESRDQNDLKQFGLVLQRNFQRLRSTTIDDKLDAIEAARLLASQLVHFADGYVQQLPDDIFFTIQKRSENTAALHLLTSDFSPLLDVSNLGLWEHEKTSHLHSALSAVFVRKLQRRVGVWLNHVLETTEGSAARLCDSIDELHIALRRSLPMCQQLFQQLWLSYLRVVFEVVDDPLCQLCKRTLIIETTELVELHPHDDIRLTEFSKSTMKMFDALRQLSTFAASHGQISGLQHFEHWFEKTAVFWTASWRSLYLGFIRKSVESAESVTATCQLNDLLDMRKCDVEMHEATVNCLAFCKALCDDYIRLHIKSTEILLICTLQIIPILTDCLNSFAVLVYQQLKENPTICNMLKTANGIEHACDHLIGNFERFLQLHNLLAQLDSAERRQIVDTIRRVMTSAQRRCKGFATEIVTSLCTEKFASLQKYSAQALQANGDYSKRKLRSYVSHVFTNDGADQLLIFLDKLCNNFKLSLLPRLHGVAMDCLWAEIRASFNQQLKHGLPPEYYEQIGRYCELICRTIGVNWTSKENSSLRQVIHLNLASTKDLILQYYARLGDLTMSMKTKSGIPRAHIRIGYIQTTSRQILLQIYVLSASDIPILDTLTKSSDPYMRIELYPRFFFPLDQFPAQNTAIKKQTLKPKWNEAFQITVPENLFFINGVSLAITVLDHDMVSYDDLAGQAMLPLASIPKLKSLSPRDLPQLTVPLILPTPEQYDKHFKTLEQRSEKDKLAREVVSYEKYLKNYRILPADCRVENRRRLKSVIGQFTKKFN